MRIGIIGAADIAINRFLPALVRCKELEYAGVASKSGRNIERFKDLYGGNCYGSYEELLADDTIDCVYIALHPAAHYQLALNALDANKHVLLEKPFTTKKKDTIHLIEYAKSKGLAMVENFAFIYHDQYDKIRECIESGEVGKIREIRARFGYPRRAENDFRYNKELGGGALLDSGVYPIKAVSMLLGSDCQVLKAILHADSQSGVDLYGNAILTDENGVTALVSFGMDNEYQCLLEIWGSKGRIYSSRIFTAPDNYSPDVIVIKSGVEEVRKINACNQFERMIRSFVTCIKDSQKRGEAYREIERQSRLVEQVKRSK